MGEGGGGGVLSHSIYVAGMICLFGMVCGHLIFW